MRQRRPANQARRQQLSHALLACGFGAAFSACSASTKQEMNQRIVAAASADGVAAIATHPGTGGGSGHGSGSGSGSGSIEPGTAPQEDLLFPDSPESYGGRRIWRLTVPQLGNTVRALLASSDAVESQFDTEVRPATGLGVEADTLGIDGDYASKLETVLGPLMQSTPGLAAYLPCGNAAAITPPCLDAFINSFGAKAFRRALSPAEVARYATVYNTVQPLTGNADALSAVAEALLRSPYTQFRTELGGSTASGADVPLTASELATALAYSITNGPPDEELLAAAASNDLLKPDVLTAQAQRLMASPNYVAGFTDFFLRFSGVTWIANASKDATLFPEYTPAMMQAMIAETKAFVHDVMVTKKGDFQALMTGNTTTITPAMAPVYQVPAFTGSQQLTPTAGQRAGFFTLPGVIAANTKAADTSPVKRGVFLLNSLVCVSPPPPPANVPSLPATTDPNATLRQRFAAHVANPTCAACHNVIDPFGFAMENYDPLGRYRTTDSGSPVDATGTVVGTQLSNVAFTSGTELLGKLADSAEVQACLVKNAFRYIFGRPEAAGDAPVLRSAYEQFVASGLNINEMLAAFYVSKAFQTRKAD